MTKLPHQFGASVRRWLATELVAHGVGWLRPKKYGYRHTETKIQLN